MKYKLMFVTNIQMTNVKYNIPKTFLPKSKHIALIHNATNIARYEILSTSSYLPCPYTSSPSFARKMGASCYNSSTFLHNILF